MTSRHLILASTLALTVALPAQAQDDTCPNVTAPDAEYASALDAFVVRWDVYRRTVDKANDAAGSEPAWQRVRDITHDGIDSLRSAPLGANEDVQLVAHVKGPARVSFWWRARPGTGDLASFSIFQVGANAAEAIDARDEKFEWERQEVDLAEAADYQLIWRYAEDGNTREGNLGPEGDGLWVDQVEVTAPHYVDIPFKALPGEPVGRTTAPIGAGYVDVSWSTLNGRIYRLEYRRKNQDGAAWREAHRPILGTGEIVRVPERPELAATRDYRVRMLDPPSFLSGPAERTYRLAEGDRFELAYEGEGSGDLLWTWTRWPPDGGDPVLVNGAGSTLTIDAVRPEDAGQYIVELRNEASCEMAPAIGLEVFQKPAFVSLGWQTAEGDPVSKALPNSTGNLLAETPEVEVQPGDRLDVVLDVSGDGPIEFEWTRREGNRWVVLQPSGAQLAVDAVEEADAGSYRVVARSEWGEATAHFRVRLLRQPKFVWVPEGQDVEVLAHDIVWLSAAPQGTPPFTYTWYENAKRVDGTTGRTYTPSTAQPTAAPSKILVHVSNGTGVISPSHSVRLAVQPLAARTIDDLGLKLLPVPAGRFQMGAARDSARPTTENEGPPRTVTLTHSFWMGETEVTYAQWSAVTGQAIPAGRAPELPASLTFIEAEAFADALTERERTAKRIGDDLRYAIPTEAQWERAARLEAPSPEDLVTTPDSGSTLPVRSGSATRSGFHDLFGNAWEWTADWYADRHDASAVVNPTGPKSGRERVLRGGGVDLSPDSLSATIRYGARINERSNSGSFGLRVVLVRTSMPFEYVFGSNPPHVDALNSSRRN